MYIWLERHEIEEFKLILRLAAPYGGLRPLANKLLRIASVAECEAAELDFVENDTM